MAAFVALTIFWLGKCPFLYFLALILYPSTYYIFVMALTEQLKVAAVHQSGIGNDDKVIA